MRHTRSFRTAALAACVTLSCGWAAAFEIPSAGMRKANHEQEVTKQEPKLSDDERRAALSINDAKDAAAKLQAAAEFIKKYPKSQARAQVSEHVAAQISSMPDTAQRIVAAETYLNLFKEPGEPERVHFGLLDAYLITERAEDSFRLGGEWLAKHPEDVDVIRRLAVTGLNQSIKGNNKFVEQGRKYGVQALDILEGDKKPATIDAAQWAEYKTKWAPAMYRETGFLAMKAGDNAAAKATLMKAAQLKTPDPLVYGILGQMNDDEYAQMAEQYKAMPAGAGKDAKLKQVQEQMDKVIEYYAQAIAVAGDDSQYEKFRTELRSALEAYYKYRHNNSTDGLQQLIDKYKKPAAQ